ncbi:hypothetical protein J4T87_0020610 [Rhizobium sp. T1473]|uniref:hypothetical protein n=1 Tax=Rhizobium sp. T1473 TaxID=555321 RepID=UPI000462B505
MAVQQKVIGVPLRNSRPVLAQYGKNPLYRSARIVLNVNDSSAFHNMMIFINFWLFPSPRRAKVFVDW